MRAGRSCVNIDTAPDRLYPPDARGFGSRHTRTLFDRIPMPRLVMKFGGTSVATVDRIRNVARHVAREVRAGYEVAVVVSAMSGKTNELVAWCKDASALYAQSEYDAVVASGEQVTSGLLAIVLNEMGFKARSWQGWQIPIETSDQHGSARIQNIDGARLDAGFKRGEVAVIAGFQGIHAETGRLTTLGRGGSDTSAVAVAAAIGAERCDIYTDVDGVYTTDPRVVPKASASRRWPSRRCWRWPRWGQGAPGALGRARHGAPGADHRALLLRRPRRRPPRHPHLRRGRYRGTADHHGHRLLEGRGADHASPGEGQARHRRRIFGPLADANINVDMIIQVVSGDGAATDMTFTVPAADYERARAILDAQSGTVEFERLEGATDVVKVSAIGVGMRSHAGVAAKAFRALAEKGINIRAITTSEIKFSVLIDAAYTELAVRTLHSLYGLDKA